MRIELKILDKELYPTIRRMAGQCEFPDTVGLPYFATDGSCAMDLRSAEEVELQPGERKKIKTGIAIWTGSKCKSCRKKNNKHGMAALILPRSGLGTQGLVLANTVGLIDEDYQGELILSVWNSAKPNGFGPNVTGTENTFLVDRGDRIAQLMFIPCIKPNWKVVEEFSNGTKRGKGGFGSTNKG